ncbi:transketolase family protein [Ruminococcus sp. AM18-15]|nr:transketolase family protein [Ruminococcus sp. AM18-44]RHO26125.1 transketolase family protein [Ruminococcus sp. AM18-15]
MGENISTRVAYGKALAEFGTDEKLFVFDADLKKCTMTLYFAEKYPERFFNIGIAEANMVDIAAGFATCGATALVHTFAIFATGRTYDQIRNSVCYPGLNVKIVGSHGGLTVGEDGATHQALEDISLMRGIPGMTVIIPCDSYEARLATKAMLEKKGPCYFRTCRPAVECVTDQFKNYNFEIGKGVQLTEGTDVTIIACGIMVQEALKAQKLLEEENIYARVIDMHTIKPIDREIIIKAAKETGAIVTVEEHNTIGGLGSAVAEVLVQTEIVPVEFVGVQDQFGHSGSPSILLKHYGLCSENIACKAKKVIERK